MIRNNKHNISIIFLLFAVLSVMHVSVAHAESTGCVHGNCTNGYGTYTWVDGAKYVGEFRDGIKSGQGTIISADGQKYVGEWKDDKNNGQGTYTWADGRKHVGEFKDGEINGQGAHTWPDGEKYIGEWKDGNQNGQGIATSSDGEKHVGEWKDGNPNGKGEFTYASGRVVEGLWENGEHVATYSDTDNPVTQVAQSVAPISRPATQQGIGNRVALIIGNSRYQHTPRLPNPENDARAIGRQLTQLGFNTEVVLDVNKADFDSALRRFGDRSERADAALFFYAGHGLEVDGINYLMPVDAKMNKKRDLKYETVSLNGILEDMEGASNIRLVFLDACRDNPLAHNLARGMGASRSVVGRGLAKVDATTGTMISYATKDGSTASDGEGRHSPYTKALLEHLNTQGLEIGLLLRRVRQSVVDETNKKQVPWEYGSLMGEFYMVQ